MTAPKAVPFAVLAALAMTLMSPSSADAMSTPEPKLVTVTPGSNLLNTSDTRTNGHVEFTKFGLRVWTDGNTDDVDLDNSGAGDHYPGWSDKAAGYVAVDYPLTDVGEPSFEWVYNEPLHLMKPGMQVVIDKDDDGDYDGILVGEPWAYGDHWWSGAAGLSDSGLNCTSGCGHTNSGTLDEWRESYPYARVMAVGFSLGSGAHGNGTLQSMTYGSTHYEFSSIEPAGKPTAAPKPIVKADSPRCDQIRIKMHVRKVAPGKIASPATIKFKIKDRARQVSQATLLPGSGAVFRRHLKDNDRLHVYRVYANNKLMLTYKARNTCD